MYYQSVKQLGSFCQAWSGSKLFAKVLSRRFKINAQQQKISKLMVNII